MVYDDERNKQEELSNDTQPHRWAGNILSAVSEKIYKWLHKRHKQDVFVCERIYQDLILFPFPFLSLFSFTPMICHLSKQWRCLSKTDDHLDCFLGYRKLLAGRVMQLPSTPPTMSSSSVLLPTLSQLDAQPLYAVNVHHQLVQVIHCQQHPLFIQKSAWMMITITTYHIIIHAVDLVTRIVQNNISHSMQTVKMNKMMMMIVMDLPSLAPPQDDRHRCFHCRQHPAIHTMLIDTAVILHHHDFDYHVILNWCDSLHHHRQHHLDNIVDGLELTGWLYDMN